MFSKDDVAGVCVTYNNNQKKIIENIQQCKSQVGTIYVIDNSDDVEIQKTLFESLSKIDGVELVQLGHNTGIAHALNIGCERAIKNGYKWALTIDQDSFIPDNMIDTYVKFLNIHKEKRIGILTCMIKSEEYDTNYKLSDNFKNIDLCWTSGSFTNLKAVNEVGGFLDQLFIDSVDFALCADFLIHGYEIIRIESLLMNHHLGNTKEYKLFGRHLFYITNHSPIRRYYMTRNSLWLSKKYGANVKTLRTNFLSYLKVVSKIILFEDQKIRKLSFMIKGYCDYKSNKLGKYSS